jgi:N-acetyl-anhydromuramyl-L-alanine amidase AmpD
MRTIKRIFVHCTASNQNATVNDILAEFKRKGWKAPGYHYLVDKNGVITNIYKEENVANGVYGYNSSAIHVAYIGGIDKAHPDGIDNRTEAQKTALVKLLKKLRARYPSAQIMGHRDISEDKNKNGKIDPWERIKACPCFDAIPEYANI